MVLLLLKAGDAGSSTQTNLTEIKVKYTELERRTFIVLFAVVFRLALNNMAIIAL